jgi:exodeoxyribonuclease VII large subunit
VDFTIADFVSDRRAPTPTAAAEIAVPRKAELVDRVAALDQALLKCMHKKLGLAADAWRRLLKRLSDPGRKLREHQQAIDGLSIELFSSFSKRLRDMKAEVAHEAARLNALSPLAVLERGYSITQKWPEASIVKDTGSLQVGDRLRILFGTGKSIVRVEEKE